MQSKLEYCEKKLLFLADSVRTLSIPEEVALGPVGGSGTCSYPVSS